MRGIVIAAVALLAVGIANIDVHPTETRTVKVPVTKVMTKYKTRTVKVMVPRTFDGMISRKECRLLTPGTKFRTIINRFGWPGDTDDYYKDMYEGSYMNYTLREDHDSFCSIDIDYDEVSGVEIL